MLITFIYLFSTRPHHIQTQSLLHEHNYFFIFLIAVYTDELDTKCSVRW